MTVNRRPSTVNRQPSAVNRQPSTDIIKALEVFNVFNVLNAPSYSRVLKKIPVNKEGFGSQRSAVGSRQVLDFRQPSAVNRHH